jgi:hypothetical protein
VPSHAVEPGTRLVDRYRLEKQLGAAGGTAYWRAHDELLDRPVGVCLLAGDDGHADRVLRAARRAAAVTDPRYLRVLDASEVDGPQGRVVYVVNEWVRATNLADLLRDGPLSPPEARELTVEIAEALEAAHGQGLSHLCLEPEHVLRTAHGQVKIVGLAVEAAVRGVEAADEADAARRDTAGAAAVAYAALTGRWPGDSSTALPAAPHDGNGLCSPRQVRAGVPHDLDHVVGRALGAAGGHEEPLRRPAELAAALGDAHVTTRIPAAISLTEPPSSDSYPPGRVAPYDDQRRRTSRTTVLAWGAVVLVLAVGLALAGSQLVLTVMGGGGNDNGASPRDTASPQASGTPTGTPITVAAVTSFDPEGDDGEENEDRVDLAVDGRASTAWTTKTYFDQFGDTGLKHGVGLVLDLGSPKDVSSVMVRTNGGASFELRAADSEGSAVDDYEVVASRNDVDGRAVLVPKEPVRARYLLVWLTKLPAVGSDYRGDISEIVVRG